MRGTILLATYNEAASIAPVLAEIEEAHRVLRRSGIDLEVVLLDDCSPDGTATIAIDAAAGLGVPLRVRMGNRTGLGAALLRGFEAEMADPPDFFITLDADGQHDPRQIPDLVRAHLSRGSGITIGSRWTRGGTSPGTPPARRVLSRLGNLLARRVGGIRDVADSTTSFRVIDPQVPVKFSSDGLDVDGYGLFSAFIAVSQAYGFTIDEVPICFRPRYSGVSKLQRRDLWRFYRNLFKIRRKVRAIRRSVLHDQTEWSARAATFAGQHGAGSQFSGDAELRSLAHADTFNAWLADLVSPAVGRRVLEVGAGVGTMSSLLAGKHPHSAFLSIEPDATLVDELRSAVEALPNVTVRNDTSAAILEEQGPARFDTVLYINVLEHIREDGEELGRARELLVAGGRLALVVPAMPKLYGSLDRKSGHFRRYRKARLTEVVEGAGFEIESVRHFDPVGVVPYWLAVRKGELRSLNGLVTLLFDRVIVPLSKLGDRVPDPGFGKNLLVIARTKH